MGAASDVAAPPSLEESRRIAEALADVGAGVVLVFGSVARGTADESSDIDLFVVFDDLDYAKRGELRLELEEIVRSVSSRSVDLFITDRPEWAIRAEGLRTTFEHHIAGDAVVLYEREPGNVRWGKEISLPASETVNALSWLMHANRMLLEIWRRTRSGRRGNLEPPGIRLCRLCRDACAVIKSCIRALLHWHERPYLPAHEVDDLLGALSEETRAALRAIFDRRSRGTINLWDELASYSFEPPADSDLRANLDYTRRFLETALDVAEFTANSLWEEPESPAVAGETLALARESRDALHGGGLDSACRPRS